MEATVGTVDNEWVSVMGEGIQIKKIVAGSGDIAEMNTIISCNLTGYFSDDKDHEYPFENLQDQVFIIGEMDTIPSIELTLRHARVGDKYWLRSSFKFAFGLVGRAGVSRESIRESKREESGSLEPNKSAPIIKILPNENLEYYIEVTGHHESAAAAAIAIASSSGTKEQNTNNSEVRVENMINSPILNVIADTELRRVCGNRWFSYGDFPKAGKSYAKGIQIASNFLQTEPDDDDENENKNERVVEILDEDIQEKEKVEVDESEIEEDSASKGILMVSFISCLNNLSACHLSMKEYAKAKELCVRVLELEPDNLKALLRGAKAALALHEYDECSLCLENVKRISPTHPSLAVENARLKSAKLAYKARDKEMGKKMASKLFSENR